MNETTIIYTDGASSGNPGPGGYGAVVKRLGKVRELGGEEDNTTNNRMEMMAAIVALNETEHNEEINLYTDSQYLINGVTKWVFGWVKNDWKTKEGKDVLNKDLWEKLHELTKTRKVNWVAVRGHAGVALNNRVDEIAVTFSKTITENINPPHLFFGDEGEYEFKVQPPTKEEMSSGSSNDRRKAKAFSYLSMVDGEILKHTTWDECKARVDGKPGAKFRKAISLEDEMAIMKEWKGMN